MKVKAVKNTKFRLSWTTMSKTTETTLYYNRFLENKGWYASFLRWVAAEVNQIYIIMNWSNKK